MGIAALSKLGVHFVILYSGIAYKFLCKYAATLKIISILWTLDTPFMCSILQGPT